MAIKTRINPKTGKKEYKVRYYFFAEGKKKDSETGWFTSQSKAEKEAQLLAARKEAEYLNNINARRDRKLYSVMDDYIEYLKEKKDKQETNTDTTRLTVTQSIRRNYFPEDLMQFKINELTVFNWKAWMSHINAQENLGGQYVRLCRQQLLNFNIWLSHNKYYLDTDYEELVDVGIRKVKLKSSKVGNKEESGLRSILSILDFRKLTYYYYKQGIEDFYNFYYYTLFYVLFFGGMRPEELTALQWKHIDLRDSQRKIYIKNAVSKIEDKDHALTRVKKGHYKTKNKGSVRIIPIFDFYYTLLLDYKDSYKYEFKLSKNEMEECFVFPNINERNPHQYMRSNKTLRELKIALKGAGLDNTDLQMFRHSCATFLILPPPNGMGFTEERVKDYFGHSDTKMLQSIYARLNTLQKADRMVDTFSSIYRPAATDERTMEEKLKEELIERMKGDNEKANIARRIRIHKQIDRALEENRKAYYYSPRDKVIIDSWLNKNPEANIKLIEEE